MKKIKKKFYSIYILFVVIVVCLPSLCSCSQEGSSLNATKEAIKKVPFSCSADCEEVIERWSLLGYSRYCKKDGLRHGKWIAFENGRLVIEGSYKLGKEDGRWIWYHSDGRVFRIVEYDEGSEISNKIINK